MKGLMETMKNSWASQSLYQDFNFIPSQAWSKTANQWIKRHFVRYDVKGYVTYEISGLVLTTMGLKELHICLLVIFSLISFLNTLATGYGDFRTSVAKRRRRATEISVFP